ncbi:Helix-hairpin-helix motif-containing protein [Spirosomataceae bacterium TFI 002]|nr:Helix-hairpin-helix motif-containing protein [Spirosomataceae bacterium TFI 002]
MGKNKIILILLFFSSVFAKAQEVPRPEIELDEFIQKLAATQQDDVNYEDLYESLLQFYLNPLDINKASAAELRNLNILSEIQVNNLLSHIQNSGRLVSLYELQGIEGFDSNTIQNLVPFIIVGDNIQSEDVTGVFKRATDHFFVLRMEQTLEQAKGYRDDKYLGSPQKLYARYRLQHPKDFSFGVIVEKDAGEPNFADYVTAHFQLQNKGFFKNMIVGDYQLQFGQGLICSGGYAAGKGGEPIYTTRRSDLGIRPHNSVLEGGFFRGTAVTIAKNNFEMTPFVSFAGRDASSNTDLSDDEDQIFSSLLIAGLHRTESEIAKKKILKEFNVGLNGKWKFPNGHIGITALSTNYNANITRTSRPYTAFEFSGEQNLVVGPNFSYSWQNFNFFGEAARSSSGGFGATGGFVAALSPSVEWAMNFRNYDKDFHSFYANSFGEGSRTINEKGVYTGIKYSPSRKITFAAFYDKFSFPWARYLVDAPSQGYDYLLRFTYKPSKKAIFYAQIHNEQKQRNAPNNDTPSDYLVNSLRSNVLANIDVQVLKKWKSQTRLQRNTFTYEGQSTSQGFAIIQDIEGSIGRLQLKSRFAYFDTDDYNSRVYAYENDILYAVSFPAYFGRGTRVYLVARYGITRNIDMWFRVARTSLTDRETISSGNNEIDAPHRTDVKMQLRYKF